MINGRSTAFQQVCTGRTCIASINHVAILIQSRFIHVSIPPLFLVQTDLPSLWRCLYSSPVQNRWLFSTRFTCRRISPVFEDACTRPRSRTGDYFLHVLLVDRSPQSLNMPVLVPSPEPVTIFYTFYLQTDLPSLWICLYSSPVQNRLLFSGHFTCRRTSPIFAYACTHPNPGRWRYPRVFFFLKTNISKTLLLFPG